ncbi:hypothetical protein Emed_000160 [Eimeria media]
MKTNTSGDEKADSISDREQQQSDDNEKCDNCQNGFVDITELLRRGLATHSHWFFFVSLYVQAAELPLPLEDKEIWLGKPSRLNKRERASSPLHSPNNPCDAHVDAEGSGGGLAADGSGLVPYLRLQAAAASGSVSISAQTAVMHRLLLWLLPLLQGSSPPRTFLRCVFFKKPVPPIVEACKEGKWNQGKASKADETHAIDLALTNNLPLLQCFCAVYVRLCLRIQALNDFGCQESFLYEEDCELSNFSSPWNGMQNTGWQDESSFSPETERETLQQYTDRVEQTCALYANSLWGVDDACVEALLQWEPAEGQTSKRADAAATPKTRQECVLRMLLKEADTDRENQEGVRKACRFLCCFSLLVEAIIVASGLESLESSPYAFEYYLAEGIFQTSSDSRGSSLPARGQATIAQAALSCVSELLALLQSQEWWLFHSHTPSSANSSSSAASTDADGASDFDLDLCFTPLFAHFRDPIEMTAEPVPSVPVYCQTMTRFLQHFHRFISRKHHPLEMLEESDVPLPLHEALPRLLMEELFACFPKEDGDRLRAVTWDLLPPTVPPFPEQANLEKRETSCRQQQQSYSITEETSGSAHLSSEKASKGQGKFACPAERRELPASLLRVYSYLSLTTVPREIERAWLSGRFKAWRSQREAHTSSDIAGVLPTPLESALACIYWGCGCNNCETWGRWKWSLQEFVLSLYAAAARSLLCFCSEGECCMLMKTLHMAPHRQVRHLQRMRAKPQVFVEETIVLLGVNRNPFTKCLKGEWGLCPPSSQMKAHAVAVALDALLLQQQHSLALTILLQLASPAEDVVIYWSLFNVLVSSEEVRTWQLFSFANEDADEVARQSVDCSLLPLFAYARFLLAVASRLRLPEGQSVRHALWPFYCIRCAPFYLALHPLWAARDMLKEVPHWMVDDERDTTAGLNAADCRAAAGDAHLVERLAKVPNNMLQRFSFEALCDSVEALSSRNALASAKLDLQEAVAELTKEGEQTRSSLNQAIFEALQETVWRLR